ncbi:MAG TPA: patatin-like phospholipase family protein [Bdellovibrionota bacterium]|nr:patatin-like phospholipase family protein [Bdellovibrionota bacterium]
MTRKKSLKGKRKIAFVASGGAVKAACFHVGVCLALQEKGFHFCGGVKNGHQEHPKNSIEIYVGSSAGAIITSLLAQGYSVDELIDTFRREKGKKSKISLSYMDVFHLATPHFFRKIKHFFSPGTKIAHGGLEALFKNYFTLNTIFTTAGVEKFLRKKTLKTNNFSDLCVEQYIVATQLDSSSKTVFGPKLLSEKGFSEEHQCDYYTRTPISIAAAASSSLPPFYQPYPVRKNGKHIYYYDGEIKKTLSTHVAKDAGADLIISSYTHQPYHYAKAVGSLADYGMPTILIQAVYQSIEQKIRTAKKTHDDKILVIDTVNSFFKSQGFPDEKRKELCDLLSQKLDYKEDLDYIFIHPHPHDYKFFFSDHFSLSGEVMEQTVRSGFKSAVRVLKDYSL